MKVTAFIGSGRKRHSYNACEKFLQNLHSLGNVEYELVRLSEYNIGTCKGCRICFDKGNSDIKELIIVPPGLSDYTHHFQDYSVFWKNP